MDGERRDNGTEADGHAASEWKRDVLKKTPGGEQKQGKDARKVGKADRTKGAVKQQDSQVAWVKKLEADNGEDVASAEKEEQKPHDRKNREKVRERKDNLKDRGDKKDAWKERRRKQDKPEDGKKEAGENSSSSTGLNGGALLNMLKASPSSVLRYTWEELISIGQLPASKVKPASLNAIIDKENTSSPLLVKTKADKPTRRRAGDGEEEEYEEEGIGGPRERRPLAERGDEEEDGEKRRGRKGWAADAGGGEYAGGWSSKAEESQWDMPDASAGNQGDLADFTLGDIRKAEKSMSGGMSMKDYKASLRAAADTARDTAKERDDLFKVDGAGEGPSLFVEEDEDVSQASRGFGKWFGARPEAAEAAGSEAEWDAPPGGLQARPGAARGAAPGLQQPEQPPARAAAGPAVAEEAAAWGAGATKPAEAAAPAAPRLQAEARKEDAPASNQAGQSILSMLGRTDLVAGKAGAAEAGSSAGGKLSVAELFHLAQGKEPSAMPKRNDGADGEGADMKATPDVYKTAQAMWAAAKAHPPPMPMGGRFPGYPHAGPYGAVPPAFGMGQGAAGAAGMMGMGRGQGEHIFHEAYAQAMMGMGRGGAQAAWPSPMMGYPPFGPRGAPGYGAPQGYSPYLAQHDFAHMSRVAGFDATAQGYASQGQPGQQASAFARPAGAAAADSAAAPRAKLAAGQALSAGSGLGAGLGLSGTSTASSLGADTSAGRLAAGTPGPAAEAGADDGNEEDAGCSQS